MIVHAANFLPLPHVVAQFLHEPLLASFWKVDPALHWVHCDFPVAPCAHPFGQPLQFADACEPEFW